MNESPGLTVKVQNEYIRVQVEDVSIYVGDFSPGRRVLIPDLCNKIAGHGVGQCLGGWMLWCLVKACRQ